MTRQSSLTTFNNKNFLFMVSIGTTICLAVPNARAQDIRNRLVYSHQQTIANPSPARSFQHQVMQAETPRLTGSRPFWRTQSQLATGTPDAPANTPPGTADAPTGEPAVGLVPAGPNPLSVYVDSRFGFDQQSIVVSNPTPTQVDLQRRIRSLSFTAAYSLNPKTAVSLSIPVISQSTTARVGNQSFKQRGSGVGDISLFVQRRFPEVAQGTEFSAAAGVVLPTGRDVFEIGPNELPTGNGFTEALIRLSIRKMRVPLQFYATVDYGKSLARTVDGQRFRLPDEYGAEIGFYYSLGPEFTAQTGLSYHKLSSPFILNAGSNVAYLSQSLTYNTGKQTDLRGTVDVGLTEDSTNAYLGLAVDSQF